MGTIEQCKKCGSVLAIWKDFAHVEVRGRIKKRYKSQDVINVQCRCCSKTVNITL